MSWCISYFSATCVRERVRNKDRRLTMPLGGDAELGIGVSGFLMLVLAAVGRSNLPRHDAVPNDDHQLLLV